MCCENPKSSSAIPTCQIIRPGQPRSIIRITVESEIQQDPSSNGGHGGGESNQSVSPYVHKRGTRFGTVSDQFIPHTLPNITPLYL